MSDRLPRRRLLHASAAATFSLGRIGIASASGLAVPTHAVPDELEAERVPTLRRDIGLDVGVEQVDE